MTMRRPPSRHSEPSTKSHEESRRKGRENPSWFFVAPMWKNFPMQKPARLKIVNRFGVTRSLPLGKPVFTIGRKAENDLQLLSDSVSRQHAEIVYEEDAYHLVDIGSKRGTFVNDQQIARCAL